MKKSCELCKGGMARIRCESDQASLCWACDAKVHSANFLVARHSRIVLCHVCQSPTPWSACGSKLKATVCFCGECSVDYCSAEEEEEEDDDVEEEDVVPWSPPPEISSSDDDGDVPVPPRKRGI